MADDAMTADDIFEEEETSSLPRREVVRGLWPIFRPWSRHFAGAFALLALSSALMIAGPILVKHAIDVDISGRDVGGLTRTVLLYALIQLLNVGVVYVMRNWLEWTGQAMMADLKRRLFDHLMSLPMAFYDRNPPGRLLSRVENDTQALRMLFTTTSVMLVGDALLFLGMFVAMGVASARLTLVMATVLPLMILTTVLFQRRIHPLFVEVRKLTAEICARLAEFVQGMPVLQAFERRRWAARSFQALNQRKFRTEFHGERLIVLWFNSLFLVEKLAYALILGVGGYWALGGTVTIGTLAMFAGYLRRFFQPLMRLSEQLATVQRALAATERILLLLREEVAIRDPERPRPFTGIEREVRFENVWFRYGEEGEWILRDLSFTLPAGERWAVVGPTGSGKTTIVALLLRFYEPRKGRILIDGVDIRDIRQEDLRRCLGLVLQDIYLFPGNLEENLRLNSEADHDAIVAASALVRADRFISRLPAGFATDLSERGANLSVGERQLLSFTRAIVRDPSLLILDEATSAVDPATEAMIAHGMQRMLEKRTALIIAHRLSTVRACERILVLRAGRIVEEGRHEELMAAHGLYRTLHDLQFPEDAHARHVS